MSWIPLFDFLQINGQTRQCMQLEYDNTVFALRFEMIDAARNKMRVKMSYLMMALTVVGCIIMVIVGKRVSVK